MRVPHPTTLMKITTRCGEDAVAGLNEALLAKAAAGQLLRTDKVRADTTVVEGDVGYPTDSGLLAKAVGTMARTVERIKAAGGARRTRARDRRRSAGRRARSIASKLRLRGEQQGDQLQAAVRRITGELAVIAEQAMREATAVIRNAKRALRTATGQRRGRLHRAINDLHTLVGRTERVVAQARSRLAGVMPESAHRLVSLIRRTNQPHQAQLRLEPHRTHQHPRSPNLMRTRRLRPQPRQDRRPLSMKIHTPSSPAHTTDTPDPRITAIKGFSGRSSYRRVARPGARPQLSEQW